MLPITDNYGPVTDVRSVTEIEQDMRATYAGFLQAGDTIHIAVARTAIAFDMHWATVKMVVLDDAPAAPSKTN
jgi:hypothetical protein